MEQTTQQPKTALIYCRVSTEHQEEEGTSLESQEAQCRAHAQKLGYSVGQIFLESHSGRELWERPKLTEVRAEIKSKKYQALIVFALDRLSRKQTHQAIIADEIERAGVELISATEKIDNTALGVFLRNTYGFMAEMELEKIRERCMRGKRQRALNGLVHRAGTELYGYRRDKERGVRVIYDEEAQIVSQIFAWILEGVSTRKVIQRLNEQGIPSPSASDNKRRFKDGRTPFWGKGAVNRILKEETYKGVTYAQRFKSAKTWREINSIPKDKWIRLPDHTTPPIVTPQIWQAAQERLKTNCGDQTRNERRQDLLRGLIFCQICGRKLLGQTEHGKTRIYRCGSRNTPHGNCGGKRVPATDCENMVWEHILGVLKNPQVIENELKRRESTGQDLRSQIQSDLESARRQYKKLENEVQNLVRRAANVSDEVWQVFEKEIAQKRDSMKRFEETIAEMESRLGSDLQAVNALEALFEYCHRVRANLANFGFAEKRLALEALGARLDGNARDWTLKIHIPLAGYTPTSCCSSGRPVPARRCSPNACLPFCPRSNSKPRSNLRKSTRSRG